MTTNIADSFETELLTAMAQAQATTLQAHAAYLAFSEGVFESLSRAVQTQFDLIRGTVRSTDGDHSTARAGGLQPPSVGSDVAQTRRLQTAGTGTVPRALTREQCMEFAIGKIGNALGATFAEVDSFPTRVRLPDAPLQLVDTSRP